MHVAIHKWSLKKRLLILYGIAGLPLVITALLTATLWMPFLRPDILVAIGLSFGLSQALVIWGGWRVISSTLDPFKRPAVQNPDGTHHHWLREGQPAGFQLDTDRLFSIFMDYLPALVVVKDPAGRYLYVNSSSQDVFGMTPDELIGHKDDEVWPKDTADHLVEIDQLVLETNQVINTTGLVPVEDEIRHLMVIKFPIQHHHQGLLLGGIIFDITDKIRADENKAQLEQQLIQSQKMEAIGTLAGGIAHDFNNILAAIFGYVELIRMDLADNPRAENQLNNVLKAAQRAKELVHQILAFSRKQDQERRPLDLAPLIKETIKLLRASLPASIEINHQLNAKDALVMADATQIHQVLMNLSTNAAHAMEAKGGRLTVCLNKLSIDTPSEAQKHCVTPGAYLELCVQDTGYGISPAQIKRIFEPYYTTKPKGKGTGMGLAVVHGIVTSHGGTIAAESHPGHGSIFRILLPITNRKHEIREAKEQVLPRGHERILFVDDEEYLADVGHRMLSRLGYSVTCCTDPLAALEVIKSRCAEFDLLITDTTMPHMSGDALAKEAMQIKPDLPVIMCTGYSEQITAEKAARLGIASFLMKPIAISDLACTLRGVLDPLSKQHATPTGTYGDEILAN